MLNVLIRSCVNRRSSVELLPGMEWSDFYHKSMSGCCCCTGSSDWLRCGSCNCKIANQALFSSLSLSCLLWCSCCPPTPSIKILGLWTVPVPVRKSMGLVFWWRELEDNKNITIKQNNDKEGKTGWFAIVLSQLLQPFAAICGYCWKQRKEPKKQWTFQLFWKRKWIERYFITICRIFECL